MTAARLVIHQTVQITAKGAQPATQHCSASTGNTKGTVKKDAAAKKRHGDTVPEAVTGKAW